MKRVIKLRLIVNEEQAHQLQAYGRAFRHEVYRVSGVFQKEERIFAFPYRYISDTMTQLAKRQVVIEASKLYRIKQRHPYAKLDYVGVWASDSFSFVEGKSICFVLGKQDGIRRISIPFDGDVNTLSIEAIRDVTVKLRDEHCFGFLRMAGKECQPVRNETFNKGNDLMHSLNN